jgi:hypothetical protein
MILTKNVFGGGVRGTGTEMRHAPVYSTNKDSDGKRWYACLIGTALYCN